MPKVPYDYLQRWCQEHGWTDLFMDQCQFWAFPPGAVLPLPIPAYAFEGFHSTGAPSARSGWLLNAMAIVCTIVGIVLTTITFSPIPLLAAFAVSAAAVALVEDHF
jgi:hypothetical protein